MNLKSFLLHTRDGYLIGMAADPELGSPCPQCVRLWLVDRNVWVEHGEISELRIKQDLLATLIQDNKPHVLD